MFCPECGEKNKPDSRFCMNCGTSLERARQQYQQDSQYDSAPAKSQRDQSQPRYEAPQSHGGYAPGSQYQSQRYTGSNPPGAVSYVCSFCLPIVGLILFFVHRNEHPDEAKNLLIVAAISFGIGILFNLTAGP